MNDHWAKQYIGIPWVDSGHGDKGQEAYNCWTFFSMVQHKHYGRDMPILGFEVDSAKQVVKGFKGLDIKGMGWEPCAIPYDGDAVLFVRGTGLPHVGIWIQSMGMKGVLHCQQGVGVGFNVMTHFFTRQWSDITYYKWTK